jgi:hypothetical protein
VTREFSEVVTQEGDLFVAQCLDVGIAGQGTSEEEALDNPRKALQFSFEDPATAAPRVRTSLSSLATGTWPSVLCAASSGGRD